MNIFDLQDQVVCRCVQDNNTLFLKSRKHIQKTIWQYANMFVPEEFTPERFSMGAQSWQRGHFQRRPLYPNQNLGNDRHHGCDVSGVSRQLHAMSVDFRVFSCKTSQTITWQMDHDLVGSDRSRSVRGSVWWCLLDVEVFLVETSLEALRNTETAKVGCYTMADRLPSWESPCWHPRGESKDPAVPLLLWACAMWQDVHQCATESPS